MNTKVSFESGALHGLEGVLGEIAPHKLFLVVGNKSYAECGAESRLAGLLRNYHPVRSQGLSGLPSREHVEMAVETFRRERCDAVLGIGGGLPMDIAKAVALLATQDEDTRGMWRPAELFRARSVPTVLIPTTAGTGSEATGFCVVYEGKIKRSLEHPSLLPDVAILDPELTFSLPPYVTACTGMDALSQAIESLWSVRSTEQSRANSREAITLVLTHLRTAVLSPQPASRKAMLWASHLAGKAIHVSRTTGAHAASYPLTAHHGIPHGHAVALTLPHFIAFNAGVTHAGLQDARGLDFVSQRMQELFDLLGVDSASAARDAMLRLMGDIGLATRLQHWGVDAQGMDLLISGSDPNRMANNPRRVSRDDLKGILLAAS